MAIERLRTGSRAAVPALSRTRRLWQEMAMVALDPSQHRAATTDHPAQLVLAGPGAGKTSTLVGRFRHLCESGVDPRRILALTFTRKSAEEMRDRIAREIGDESPAALRVHTFHSLALRCLQRNPRLAGLAERVDVWSTAQQRAVFTSRRMYWNDDGDILDIIAAAKERLLDAAAFSAAVARDDEAGRRAAAFFAVYETALRDADAIDFADMVPRLLKAIGEYPAYGRSVAGAIDHLLVDEFQDINLGQHRLIEHFRAGGVQLWAVGDDDQTLFSFRAADVRYTLDFVRRHGARLHVLDRNYRSAPEIVAGAKRLIAHNRGRIAKDYAPATADAGLVTIRGYSNAEAELRQVSRAVATLVRGGLAPERIAVLYRAGSVGLAYQGALDALGLNFDVRGAGDLWQGAAAKLFLGALHYAMDDDDRRAIELLGVGARGLSVRRRLDRVAVGSRKEFRTVCRHVRRIVSETLPKSSPERERRDWANLCDAVAGLAARCTGLDELLARIADQSRALRTPKAGAVVLSTIHSAKGLEWDAVFVVGLEDGVLPSGGADVEEERRVAYVAATRARRILSLTFAAERGGTRSGRSRFVAEFAGDAVPIHGAEEPSADDGLPLGPPYAELPAPPRIPALPSERHRAVGTPRRPGDGVAQWTAGDDARLTASFATADALEDLCAATGMAGEAVMSRLVRLKLVPSRAAARRLWCSSRRLG